MDKLIIPRNRDLSQSTTMLRVDKRAGSFVDQLARETGRSKSYIASRLIEWAYDRTEIQDSPGSELRNRNLDSAEAICSAFAKALDRHLSPQLRDKIIEEANGILAEEV